MESLLLGVTNLYILYMQCFNKTWCHSKLSFVHLDFLVQIVSHDFMKNLGLYRGTVFVLHFT